MADVFISYSHQDKIFVDDLAAQLAKALGSKSVWYDSNLKPGAKFNNVILQEIVRAPVFLFVLSTHSLASAYCIQELDAASKLEKHIIPVIIEQVTPSDNNERKWLKTLKLLQYVDMRPGKNNIATLLSGIRDGLEKAKQEQKQAQKAARNQKAVQTEQMEQGTMRWGMFLFSIVMVAALVAGTGIKIDGDKSIRTIIRNEVNNFFGDDDSGSEPLPTRASVSDSLPEPGSAGTEADELITNPPSPTGIPTVIPTVVPTHTPTFTFTPIPTVAAVITSPPLTPLFVAEFACTDSTPTMIAFKETVTGKLEQPYEVDCYSFVVEVSSHIQLKITTSGEYMELKVFRPDGTYALRNFGEASACSYLIEYRQEEHVCALDVTGVYVLVIEAQNFSSTGDYSFDLRRID